MSMKVMFSSDTPEWGTPSEFFRALDEEFNFKIDVCASEANAKCKRYFSRAEDGLSQPWESTSWMNPPYGPPIRDWMAKAYSEAQRGVRVVCLLPARVDTRWWFDFVLRADEIRFYKGRLKFVALDGVAEPAPFPSAAAIFLGRRGRAEFPVVNWCDQPRAARGDARFSSMH